MLLAINANNTNTVFAVWDGDRLKGSWRAATDGRRTADEHERPTWDQRASEL